MLRMPGGMLPRLTNAASPTVCYDLYPLLWSPRSISHLYAVAVQALTQTVTMLTKAGRFRQAADREKEIAQIYLQEMHDLRRACESFERAGEWYQQEDAGAYVPSAWTQYICIDHYAVPPTHASRMPPTFMQNWKTTRTQLPVMNRSRTTLLGRT